MSFPLSRCRWPDDVSRIMKVAFDRHVYLSPLDAQTAWEDYSETMCAGWLCLPETDEEIWDCLPAWAKGETE